MRLHKVLITAYEKTLALPRPTNGRTDVWVKVLGTTLQTIFGPSNGIRIFFRGCTTNRDCFHKQQEEMLFDIHICKTRLSSAIHQRFIERAIWQIESEVPTRSTRSANKVLEDFQKLVVGSAPNKLFIAPSGPTKPWEDEIFRTLKDIAPKLILGHEYNAPNRLSEHKCRRRRRSEEFWVPAVESFARTGILGDSAQKPEQMRYIAPF